MKEVRQVSDLLDCEIRAGSAALGRVAFLEEGTDGVAVAVVQDGDRADEVGAALGGCYVLIRAASFVAVAGNAFRHVYRLSTFGGGGIDYVLIVRSGSHNSNRSDRS